MVISWPLPRSKGIWIPAVCFRVRISLCVCVYLPIYACMSGQKHAVSRHKSSQVSATNDVTE